MIYFCQIMEFLRFQQWFDANYMVVRPSGVDSILCGNRISFENLFKNYLIASNQRQSFKLRADFDYWSKKVANLPFNHDWMGGPYEFYNILRKSNVA